MSDTMSLDMGLKKDISELHMEQLSDSTSCPEDVHGLWKCDTELHPNTGFHQPFISRREMHGAV